MTLPMLAVVLSAAAAALSLPPPVRRHRDRVRRLHLRAPSRDTRAAATGRGRVGSAEGGARGVSRRLQRSVGLLAGLWVAVLTGGYAGVVTGAVVAVALHRVLPRLETRAARLRRRQTAADLPVAADLLAACLAAGLGPPAATASVATAVGGPLGRALATVVSRLELGADPHEAWGALADEPAAGPLARACRRAVESGAPLADAADELAREVRAAARAQAEARARRVGVQAVAPLGMCFLPAFMLLGVVPVVTSIASGALGATPS